MIAEIAFYLKQVNKYNEPIMNTMIAEIAFLSQTDQQV